MSEPTPPATGPVAPSGVDRHPDEDRLRTDPQRWQALGITASSQLLVVGDEVAAGDDAGMPA